MQPMQRTSVAGISPAAGAGGNIATNEALEVRCERVRAASMGLRP